ncbi:bifunctional 4-hydroxy-2-oxoglutarate aldolase/2-dehydro-3-deoxy-phosphogluconate aldolase [Adhaeribacter aquaticus]|uniref:bifunctional 4-hydroxy-2-oxoglutarate aldolase/2-dehydro-3-deoxy-phosphogluconate aldolase n=1 Tax=Adhaeribacter aquaticus TaxID=299567 RepID=UPI0004050600|nr:bifunctional 4-hydroxy-2-oxoglutarate aldolase/2-dehydro-3-deoxy-phosphogluconate aldolase [Adhaeribacter aquaticus]
MNPSPFSWDKFNQMPLVGIIRNLTLEEIQHIIPLYKEAGLTTLEITMNTPQAADIIHFAFENYGQNLNIGAGTVCSEEDLEIALAAGAQFIVTPIINKKVIKASVKKGIPIFPGAYTPTEIYKAWTLGASMVKIYPATSLGPEYIKDLKAPLNRLKVMPTGGISLGNLKEFLLAGSDGFGIGSQLFDKKLIKENDWMELQAHFKAYVNAYLTAKPHQT